MNAVPQAKMSLEAFLAWENAQPERHEFHRGEVFAMVGARRAHGRVVSNLNRRLNEKLEGSPCQAFAETMKLQIGADTILYPDIFVTCDKADLATEVIFRAPTVVVEVLSPSTQGYDRSQKFALYRAACLPCANTCWSTPRHAVSKPFAVAATTSGCCTT